MKKIFKAFFLTAAILLTGVSCNQEYLETTPESSTSPATIFATTDNAVLAVNGICKMMTSQYWSTQGLNGEGSIKTWWGNFGNDLQRCNQTGWANLWNHQYNRNASSTYCTYPWYYYYKMIGNANQIIANIDDAEGPDSEKQFIKAQAPHLPCPRFHPAGYDLRLPLAGLQQRLDVWRHPSPGHQHRRYAALDPR